jgi:hypothetical protein
MKTHLRLLPTLVLSVLLAGSAFAHPGGHGEDLPVLPKPKIPPRSALTLPATAADTLAAIQRQLDALKTALNEGNLPSVRSNAATLSLLVNHIVSQVPADHQANAKEIAERHAKLTEELSKAASAGAQKEVESLVTKISGNVRALKLIAH